MSRYYLGVTINQVPRFYAYQDQACADAEAAVRALTPAQRLAQTTTAVPAAPTDATWQVRNCAAAASVTSVTCVQVGNTTVITVTATAPCEINITAVSGGAQWGDATSWYATTLVSGTTYTKTWTFLFVAGVYHIRARVTGTTDATKYVACDFTATASTGGITAVSAAQVNNTTVITVSGTGASQINITPVSGGAEWADTATWFDTTAGTKTFSFPFVAGLYHIRARATGNTDASTYVGADYTAPASGGGDTGGGSSPDLDTLIPDLVYTGVVTTGTNTGVSSVFNPSANLINGRWYPVNTASFSPPGGYMTVFLIDNEPFYRITGQEPASGQAHPDYPGAEQGYPIHITMLVVPSGTAVADWQANGNPNYPNAQATLNPF